MYNYKREVKLSYEAAVEKVRAELVSPPAKEPEAQIASEPEIAADSGANPQAESSGGSAV